MSALSIEIKNAKEDSSQNYFAFLKKPQHLSLSSIRCSSCEWNTLMERRDSLIHAFYLNDLVKECKQLIFLMGGPYQTGKLDITFIIASSEERLSKQLISALQLLFQNTPVRRLGMQFRKTERTTPFFDVLVPYGLEEGDCTLFKDNFV